MPIDPHSATWETVEGKAKAALDEATRRLRQPGLDPVKTEFERGRIRMAEEILSLATPEAPAPEIQAPTSIYD